jgi:regulator of replication initiation timing
MQQVRALQADLQAEREQMARIAADFNRLAASHRTLEEENQNLQAELRALRAQAGATKRIGEASARREVECVMFLTCLAVL